MQSNGAEMLRLACIAATEAGIEVCAPVHDAILIAAPLERLEADVATVRAQMALAGAAVTGGLPVRTDAELVRWPDRFMDERGSSMWRQVMSLLDGVVDRSAHPPVAISDATCIDQRTRSLFL